MPPVRTCVGCRTRFEQPALRRFVRRDDGWAPGGGRRREGRGVYLCSAVCARRAEKNRRYPGLGIAAMSHFERDTRMD